MRKHEPRSVASRSWIAALTILLCTLALPHAAFAQAQSCTVTSTPQVVQFGNVTPAPSLQVGSAIPPVVQSTFTVNCPSRAFTMRYISGANLSAVTNVWQTNVPGVGVRAILTSYNGQARSKILSNLASGQDGELEPGGVPAVQFQLEVSYQLYKTDNTISPGSVQMPDILGIFSRTNQLVSGTPGYVSIDGTTISSSTCSVVRPNVAVALPQVSTSSLAGAGTTAGTTPFQIDLNCMPSTSVSIRFTDANAPGNQSQILTLAPTSTATGVGLQILLRNNQPVTFGTTYPVGAAGAGGGAFPINLFSRYYATGAVTSGRVDGIAEFWLTYN